MLILKLFGLSPCTYFPPLNLIFDCVLLPCVYSTVWPCGVVSIQAGFSHWFHSWQELSLVLISQFGGTACDPPPKRRFWWEICLYERDSVQVQAHLILHASEGERDDFLLSGCKSPAHLPPPSHLHPWSFPVCEIRCRSANMAWPPCCSSPCKMITRRSGKLGAAQALFVVTSLQDMHSYWDNKIQITVRLAAL